jgi:hypothetical protein
MPKRTPGGKKTAVAVIEAKLKRAYPKDSGAVYGTLNKVGLMKGSKVTAKGKKAART